MRIDEQTLVAAVAVVLGLVLLAAAIGDWGWWYQLDKMRWFRRRFGPRAARLLYGLLGAALIGVGVAVACGYRLAPPAR